MAEARRYGLTPQLDIIQIQEDARSRWLRPMEICEILKNYQRFQISPEPPNRPASGSLFLFDRKVLRYFRRDGHDWRKKKDGRTVKEAHEKLKAGSVDVLHCYYAHGEANPNFQRRTYWMLEEEYMHIVLVHYREVKDKKETYGRTRDVEEVTQNLYDDRPVGSNSSIIYHQILSSNADGESLNTGQTSEYEDAEHDTSQASSRYHPIPEFGRLDGHSLTTNINLMSYYPVLQHNVGGNDPSQKRMAAGTDVFSVSQEDITTVYDNSGFEVTINGPKGDVELQSWEAVLNQCAPNFSNVAFPPTSSGIPASMDDFQKSDNVILDGAFADGLGIGEVINQARGKAEWQDLAHVAGLHKEGNLRYATLMKQLSLDIPNVEGEKGLQKHDSFSKWITRELRELDDVDETPKPSTGNIWDVVDGENGVEDSCLSPQQDLDYLSPSLSQDQLFSIDYVTPDWAFSDSEIMVFVSGTFLISRENIQKVNWSCMFGQNEVCAEVIGDGLLRCLTPLHKPGRIPFYVTCSNRLACSEVREFEFHADDDQTLDKNNETLLYLRLERLLSAVGVPDQISPLDVEKIVMCNKIDYLFDESRRATDKEFTCETKDELLQMFLKDKLHLWLLEKVAEGGKGPNVMDKEGQGVIHLAAALNYHWAIAPIVAAGVNINFRDARGWTALHWAAAFGREDTIVKLLSLNADPGLLTDPTPECPSGRTPADLSSCNGHKGIAGYLAESSLTKHLSTLDLKETGGSGMAGTSSLMPTDRGRDTNQFHSEESQSQQSLKDSLGAVRNAAQAYARIYQVYRMQSFQRKKVVEYENSEFGMPEEQAMALVATKANKFVPRDDPMHAAAVRIQNKFRGWKGRKEFLVIRQQIVKIQAHIRGYQVRKHYRKVVWSVLIVEKAILRWRRKGSGFRRFRCEGPSEGLAAQIQAQPAKEDDYDYLRQGRKQTEERLQRALARVKSMVQYPEARDQYRRLVTGVEESKKVMLQRILNESDETNDDEMFDIDELVAEDTYMPTF